MLRVIICNIVFTLISISALAQSHGPEFGIAYYNVGQLREVEHSDNRSNHRNHIRPSKKSASWNQLQYNLKIRHTARVIDSIALPIAVVYGVESEQVVRDLVEASSRDYAYIYRNQNINDGLEFAVLYQADRFMPEKLTEWEKALCIEGIASGNANGLAGSTPLKLILSHQCTSIGELMRSCRINTKTDKIILIGQFNNTSIEQLSLSDTTLVAQQMGHGNYAEGGQWKMHERVATNIGGKYRCDVFVTSWLLNNSSTHQSPHNSKRYYYGSSSNLPLYIYFEDLFAH